MTVRARHDRGFTLIELLLVIVITGLISVSLVRAVIVGVQGTTDVTTAMGQSGAAQVVNRYLTGDIHEAEGVVLIGSSDISCGGVAPLKLMSRSAPGVPAPDTTTVWVLSGSNLVRRTCGPSSTTSFVVTTRVSSFVPAPCTAPCTQRAITVTMTAAGSSTVVPYSWVLSVTRRNA